MLMVEYGKKTELYRESIFKLLQTCCQHVRDSTDQNNESTLLLSYSVNDCTKNFDLNGILTKLLTSSSSSSSCDCFSPLFLIETKLHFERMITFWVAKYYETQLLSEAVRLETFKTKWTNQFVTASSLAKTGFFYVGPTDHVQCVFCKVVIGGWELGDIAEGEHRRIAKHCSMHNGLASNIPMSTSTNRHIETDEIVVDVSEPTKTVVKTKPRRNLFNIFKKL